MSTRTLKPLQSRLRLYRWTMALRLAARNECHGAKQKYSYQE